VCVVLCGVLFVSVFLCVCVCVCVCVCKFKFLLNNPVTDE
jgi:hypothetical protein